MRYKNKIAIGTLVKYHQKIYSCDPLSFSNIGRTELYTRKGEGIILEQIGTQTFKIDGLDGYMNIKFIQL